MSDAAELMVAVYEHLTPMAARTAQPHLLNEIFGLHVQVTAAHTCTGSWAPAAVSWLQLGYMSQCLL